jgi:hypothetical protein
MINQSDTMPIYLNLNQVNDFIADNRILITIKSVTRVINWKQKDEISLTSINQVILHNKIDN